jgi:hypothetical protein
LKGLVEIGRNGGAKRERFLRLQGKAVIFAGKWNLTLTRNPAKWEEKLSADCGRRYIVLGLGGLVKLMYRSREVNYHIDLRGRDTSCEALAAVASKHEGSISFVEHM